MSRLTDATQQRVLWRKRVLWVDDDIESDDPALRLLSLDGFDVDCARTGLEGVQKGVREPYAGILLDLRLPDMSGLSVLQQLRTDGVDTPVLVVTGFPNIESAVSAVKLGALDFKPKPLVGDDLVEAVRVLVSSWPRDLAPNVSSPDFDAKAFASPLHENAVRLAKSSIGLLEFVILTQSFRRLTIDADSLKGIEATRRCLTMPDAALANDLLEHIADGLSRKTVPSLETLADATSVPVDCINSILKGVTQLDFRQCRRALRVRPTVREVAMSHEQIAQIAYRHGYQWPGQLDRDFKATLLLTPKAFRRLFLSR